MKNLLIGFILGALLMSGAFALNSTVINDANVEFEQGYFVGVFYKDIETGAVYKVDRVEKDTIYITNFENGELLTGENSEKVEGDISAAN